MTVPAASDSGPARTQAAETPQEQKPVTLQARAVLKPRESAAAPGTAPAAAQSGPEAAPAAETKADDRPKGPGAKPAVSVSVKRGRKNKK